MTEELKLTNEPAADERKNRPSASAMHRLFSCPGSWLAEQKCPKLPPSPQAIYGTRLHAHMQHGTTPTDPTDIEAVEWCRKEEAETMNEIFCSFDAPTDCIREKRLWNRIDAYSGQADVVYMNGDTALVFDYKFGRGEVQPASENAQLLTLSALIFDNYPHVNCVYAGILQPFAENRTAYELAFYERRELQNMKHTIRTAIDNANKENAPLVPSAIACKYCRAAATCPAAWQASLTQREILPLTQMTPAAIADLLDRANMAERLADAVKTAVKQHLQNGNEIPGWKLASGKTTNTISDPQEAFRRLNEAHGINAEQFTACCKVNMTSLYSMFYTVLNKKEKTTQKAAKAECLALLAGCMESKTSDGSLKKSLLSLCPNTSRLTNFCESTT